MKLGQSSLPTKAFFFNFFKEKAMLSKVAGITIHTPEGPALLKLYLKPPAAKSRDQALRGAPDQPFWQEPRAK